MEPRIAGKVAVVTGASSGIGRATALALAREGARVALVARTEERLRELAREIALVSRERHHSDRGADELMALVAPADVSDPDSVEAMAGQVVDELGWPEILVNNAGTGHWSSFAETSPETVRRVMEVNFFGALHCTRAFLPAMLERGAGSLTFVSSGLGELPFPKTSIYCASKFAMHGFARSLRAEVEPLGVHVLLMMPGSTDTEFFDANVFPKEVLEEFLSQEMDPPEAVADRIVESIAASKRRATMSWTSDLGLRLSYLFPTLTALFLNRIGERLGREDRVTPGKAGETPEYSDLLQDENPDELDRQGWEWTPEEGVEIRDDEDR